ncbi:HAD family hydrolase [Shewanella maritima]|uniref:HAD family hydrolase n=1 Tax=Shewanella maritima TaxID=2520507 RepID=UPI003734FEE7
MPYTDNKETQATLLQKTEVQVKGVLFDVDGTLVDTAPDLVAALNASLLEENFATHNVDSLRHAASHGSLHLVRCALPNESEATHISIQQKLLAHYHKLNGEHARLFDGMTGLLNLLNKHNIPFGVVTNKQAKFARPLMKALSLDTHCKATVSGDSTKHPKPHPAPMLLAAQQISVDPQNILYLGDAERDLIAAQNASMIGGTALWGYIAKTDEPESWPATVTFDTPDSVAKWLVATNFEI